MWPAQHLSAQVLLTLISPPVPSGHDGGPHTGASAVSAQSHPAQDTELTPDQGKPVSDPGPGSFLCNATSHAVWGHLQHSHPSPPKRLSSIQLGWEPDLIWHTPDGLGREMKPNLAETQSPTKSQSSNSSTIICYHFYSSILYSEVAQLCLTLCNLWTVAYQAPPSMGLSRQEYWSGVPLPSPL